MWLTTLFATIVSITQRRPSLVDTVRRGLLDDLVLGTLSPGDKLPNEDRIGERFGVSRATVREAVLGLLEAGYLTRRHGSGTYVSKAPRSRHPLESTVDYTAMIRAAGHTPTLTILSETTRPATPEEFEHLLAETVIEQERLRLADDRPIIYSRDRFLTTDPGTPDPPRVRPPDPHARGRATRRAPADRARHPAAQARPDRLRRARPRGAALSRVARGRRVRADRQSAGVRRLSVTPVAVSTTVSPSNTYPVTRAARDLPPTPKKYAAIARFIPARAIIHGQRGFAPQQSRHQREVRRPDQPQRPLLPGQSHLTSGNTGGQNERHPRRGGHVAGGGRHVLEPHRPFLPQAPPR